MKTTPIYLEHPYQKTMTAKILDVMPDTPGVWRLILDQTIFYPMGGGQPTDQGLLQWKEGPDGQVYQVLLKEGEINHYVRRENPPQIGEEVEGSIDWERRYQNMRVHSAAHVIDFALYLMGYTPHVLKPLKGDHGKKPFIVYGGILDGDIRGALEAKARELIQKDMQFSWAFRPLEEMQSVAIYLQPGLPVNKPLRALTLEGVGTVADGGTIVSRTGEVGNVEITAIDNAEGNTIIKYKI